MHTTEREDNSQNLTYSKIQEFKDTCYAAFFKRAVIVNDDDCWGWPGAPSSDGYSVLTVALSGGYFHCRAHRLAFFLFRGDIQQGLVLDHLCRNRACVNPFHLEQVTSRVNVLRGIGISAEYSHRTNCARGHPLCGSNLFIDCHGRRVCLECRRRRAQEYQRRMRAEVKL